MMERLTDTTGQLYACGNNLCEEGMSCAECRYREEAEIKLTAYEGTGLTPEEIAQMNDFINSQCAKLLAKNTALQAEVDRLREEKSMHRVSVNAGASAIKQLKAENERLRAERDAAIEELNDAQPCFACAGFSRNGGMCHGAGECRIRDFAKSKRVDYKDHAGGESWRWRGLEADNEQN